MQFAEGSFGALIAIGFIAPEALVGIVFIGHVSLASWDMIDIGDKCYFPAG